jgi:hypothetical protein
MWVPLESHHVSPRKTHQAEYPPRSDSPDVGIGMSLIFSMQSCFSLVRH